MTTVYAKVLTIFATAGGWEHASRPGEQSAAGQRAALTASLVLMLVGVGVGLAQPIAVKAVIDALSDDRTGSFLIAVLVVLLPTTPFATASAWVT